MELESDSYDVVVIGTGIAESIAAAALAKAGKSVLHLDPNDYYGGEQASLTLDELVQWSSSQPAAPSPSSSSSTSISYSQASTSALTPSLEADRRRYALSLFPAVLPSRGALIDTLISSDVSKYVSFRMLDSVAVWDEAEGGIRRVPGSKEEVFKDKSVGLLEKRKLMKFLMFAAGDFETEEVLQGKEAQPLIQFLQESFTLPSHLATSITYAIAHCTSLTDETLPALLRTRRYLKSIGRYGPSAFLVGQYGGAGEVAQGFCRACAVFGGTYVLGESAIPESIEASGDRGITFKLPCHPRPVTASHLIASSRHIPSSFLTPPASSETSVTSHCVAIVSSLPEALQRKKAPVQEGEEGTEEEVVNDDTAVVVFPPEGDSPLVRCFVMAYGTGSCPSGQFIIYLSSPASPSTSPSDHLKLYLQRLVSEPLFESYYQSSRPSASPSSQSPHVVVLAPYSGRELLTEGLDWEAKQGEDAYYSVVGRDGQEFFEKAESEQDDMGVGEDDL
ncbi:hypothetical protein IAT38_001243 [Cryptococcus sp. DSM 104549]